MKSFFAICAVLIILAVSIYLNEWIDTARETWPWYYNVIAIAVGIAFIFAMKKRVLRSIQGNSLHREKAPRLSKEDVLRYGKDGNSTWVTVTECEGAIDWLTQHRDPGLWHRVVIGFNYDEDCTYETVEWIIKQPDCQNTIAVTVMELIHMSDYCGVGALKYREETTYSILKAISYRDQEDPFPSDLLSDPKRLDRKEILKRCLAAESECKAQGKQPLLPVPHRTLSTRPKGPRPSTHYAVGEEGISELQPKASAV